MSDRELLLRFLTLCVNWDRDAGEIRGYKGNMKSFMNGFMKEYQHDNGNLNYFKALCDETIDKVFTVYGVDAFRRLNEDGTVTPINRAIMDAIMIASIPYSKERLLSKKKGDKRKTI